MGEFIGKTGSEMLVILMLVVGVWETVSSESTLISVSGEAARSLGAMLSKIDEVALQVKKGD